MAVENDNSKIAKTRDRRKAVAAGGSDARLLAELKARLAEISDLRSAGAVLGWDEAVFMPPGGAASRGRQKARLASLAHQRSTDVELGRLLDALAPHATALPPDSDDAALITVSKRDYDRAIRVPAAFVARESEHGSASYQAWTAARPANDFAAVAPFLEVGLDLAREYASFFPGHAHPMDVLIGPDEGVTAAEVETLFTELRAALVPLVQGITAQAVADDSCLRRHFPASPQIDFATAIAADFGYDGARGRIDRSPHPFCTTFARDDVRITTRVNENVLSDALFSIWHEVGHALYELGVDASL